MGEKLHWIKEAFSRKTTILDGDKPIGEMWQDSLFSSDVQARLNDVFVLFDVKGFLKRSVNIHDQNNGNKIIGVIHFHIGRKAELVLPDAKYLWRRQNFFMREWSLIQVSEDESSEVFHYEQLRSFFVQTGEVSGAFSIKQPELLILSGLFIGNYFRRRRRRAAAAS